MFHARFNAITLSDVALSGTLRSTDYHRLITKIVFVVGVIYDTCPGGAVGKDVLLYACELRLKILFICLVFFFIFFISFYFILFFVQLGAEFFHIFRR